MAYASKNNAVLFSNCTNLQNLTVTVEIGQDLGTANDIGWSLQLNCYPIAGSYCQVMEVNWLQYMIWMRGGTLLNYIQYWSLGSKAWPPGYTEEPGTTPWLPCWPHDFDDAATFATGLNGDALPSGSKLQISFANDINGGVGSATCIYTDPNGNAQEGLFVFPTANPINGFQLNFVGLPGYPALFPPDSVPSALISYSVSSGELSVYSDDTDSGCVGVCVSGETSNMVYSDISGSPGGTVTQTLQQVIAAVTPTILSFDPQAVGTTSPQKTVTVGVLPGTTVTSISFMNNTPANPQFVCVPPPGDPNLDLQDGVFVITVWYCPTVAVNSNAVLQIAISDGSALTVALTGTGLALPVPLLNVSPGSLIFTAKQLTNHIVTLSNLGTGSLTIASIVIEGSSSFTFTTTCNVGRGGGMLNPGQKCTITVSFHGTINSNADLVITHDAGSPGMVSLVAEVGKSTGQ